MQGGDHIFQAGFQRSAVLAQFLGLIERENKKQIQIERDSIRCQELITEDILVVSQNVTDLMALTLMRDRRGPPLPSD